MKRYTLILNIILKSGKEKRYESFNPEAMTKKEVEEIADSFKDIMDKTYKNEIVGTITLKNRSGTEVLINSAEIALIEFEIVEC